MHLRLGKTSIRTDEAGPGRFEDVCIGQKGDATAIDVVLLGDSVLYEFDAARVTAVSLDKSTTRNERERASINKISEFGGLRDTSALRARAGMAGMLIQLIARMGDRLGKIHFFRVLIIIIKWL